MDRSRDEDDVAALYQMPSAAELRGSQAENRNKLHVPNSEDPTVLQCNRRTLVRLLAPASPSALVPIALSVLLHSAWTSSSKPPAETRSNS